MTDLHPPFKTEHVELENVFDYLRDRDILQEAQKIDDTSKVAVVWASDAGLEIFDSVEYFLIDVIVLLANDLHKGEQEATELKRLLAMAKRHGED